MFLRYWGRWGVFLAQVFLYVLLSVPLHEWWHYQMALWIGVSGSIKFNSQGDGWFIRDNPGAVTSGQSGLIGLIGGLGTAAVFSLLWLWSHHKSKKSNSEISTSAILLTIILYQAIYGVGEAMTRKWADAQWFGLAGVVVGVGVAAKIYGKPFKRWLFEE